MLSVTLNPTALEMSSLVGVQLPSVLTPDMPDPGKPEPDTPDVGG